MKTNFLSHFVTATFLFSITQGLSCVLPDSTGMKTIDGKNYIVHKVEAKETWYGIAKRYSFSADELQIANPQSKDLKAGQEVLIPQHSPIIKREPLPKADTIKEAIYYDVKKKETLYSIAKTYNTVPDSLKKWNNISSKKVKSGAKLIVGYKITIIEPPKPAMDTVADKVKPVSPPKAKTKSTSSKKDTSSKKNEPPKVKRPVSENGIASWIGDDSSTTIYYALHRTAPPGTIIKVTNKMNKKYVFVKVLAALPDTGDNYDLVIKISKSSAEKLGVRDRRFQCELNYSVTE
jgi:LysM repeat protein